MAEREWKDIAGIGINNGMLLPSATHVPVLIQGSRDMQRPFFVEHCISGGDGEWKEMLTRMLTKPCPNMPETDQSMVSLGF